MLHDPRSVERIVNNFLYAPKIAEADRAGYQRLLYYAALPLVLTPELLHYLRYHFTPQTPWVAEVDILLAEELCQVRAFEQYTMRTPVRDYLLAQARHEIDIAAAANLLIKYISEIGRTHAHLSEADLQTQAWAAMVYTGDHRADAVAQIKEALKQAAGGQEVAGLPSDAELERLARLTQSLAGELAEYPEVVEYARQVSALLRGEASQDQNLLRRSQQKILPDMPPAAELAGVAAPEQAALRDSLTIFISAWSEDNAFRKRLADDLARAGHSLSFDPDAPFFGADWQQEINSALRSSDALILIVSPDAIESRWVRAEWSLALENCITIVPVLYRGDYDLLPAQLSQIRGIDFRDEGDYGRAMAELLEGLAALPVVGRLYNVPDPPPGESFLRQDDIPRVKQQLLGGEPRPAPVTSTGLLIARAGLATVIQGGPMGKTALATLVARDCEVRRSFPDGIFWLRIGSEPDIEGNSRRFLEWLGQTPPDVIEPEELAQQVQALLAERAALIILDNVREPADIRAFLADDTKSSLLITTRNKDLLAALRTGEQDGTAEPAVQSTEPLSLAGVDDLMAAVVGVVSFGEAPNGTGFLLAEPRVIVTDAYYHNFQKIDFARLRIVTPDGRQLPTEVLRLVPGHPFGPLVLRAPAELTAAGLRLDPAPLAANSEIRVAIAAGPRAGLLPGRVATGREITLTITPVGRVEHLVELHVDTAPGSSGAPVVDQHMAVRGFIVGGGSQPSRPVMYPTARWYQALLSLAETGEAAGPTDPFEVLHMGPNRPLVDREMLRSALRELLHGRRNIFIVNGPPGSGKTYTYELIRYLEQQTGAFRSIYIDMASPASAPREPDDLVQEIAQQMGWEFQARPQQTKSPERWTIQLINWLSQRLGTLDRPLWVVLDGADQVELPRATYDFIIELCERSISQPSLRVILLGYNQELPDSIKPYAVQEDLERITNQEILQYLTQWVSVQDLSEKVSPERLHQVVDRLSKLLYEDEGNLNRLAANLTDTMARLTGDLEAR